MITAERRWEKTYWKVKTKEIETEGGPMLQRKGLIVSVMLEWQTSDQIKKSNVVQMGSFWACDIFIDKYFFGSDKI